MVFSRIWLKYLHYIQHLKVLCIIISSNLKLIFIISINCSTKRKVSYWLSCPLEKRIIENDRYLLFNSEDNVQVMCSNLSGYLSVSMFSSDPSLVSLLSEWLCWGCQSFPAASLLWTLGSSSDLIRKTSSMFWTCGATRYRTAQMETKIMTNLRQRHSDSGS